MIASTSAGSAPACFSAGRAASPPMNAAVSCGAAIWRWRMPVRSLIHASDVSTERESSSLLTMRSGRYAPTPAMIERIGIVFLRCGGEACSAPTVLVVAAVLRSYRHQSGDSRQVLAHVVVEAVHDHVHRHIDRVRESLRVRAAMLFYHTAVQPEHPRPIISARVQPFAQPLQPLSCQQVGDARGEAAAENLAQQIADQLQRPFAGLQRN